MCLKSNYALFHKRLCHALAVQVASTEADSDLRLSRCPFLLLLLCHNRLDLSIRTIQRLNHHPLQRHDGPRLERWRLRGSGEASHAEFCKVSPEILSVKWRLCGFNFAWYRTHRRDDHAMPGSQGIMPYLQNRNSHTLAAQTHDTVAQVNAK